MPYIKKYLGFDDRWMMLMGIPVVSIVIMMMILGPLIFHQEAVPCLCIMVVYVCAYWFSFRFVLMDYHRRFNNDYKFGKNRIVYITLRMFIFYILVKFGIGTIMNIFFPEQVQFFKENQVAPYAGDLAEVIMIFLIFFIYEGIYYFNKSRMIEIEKNKLEKVTAEQTLNTLKNQVNPHFLFNSLNTLVTIIPEDKNQAIKFVHELSKTYRTILEVRDEKLITIEKELEALESYIYLLKTRFQGKIEIENKVPFDYNKEFVLPISLQILIENAVKHNIVSKSKPLKIEIYIEDKYLVVRNNLQKKNQEFVSTKVGLTNIRSRYQFMTSQEVIVEETETDFIVKLPLINNSKS